jgi:hypothetical protein
MRNTLGAIRGISTLWHLHCVVTSSAVYNIIVALKLACGRLERPSIPWDNELHGEAITSQRKRRSRLR